MQKISRILRKLQYIRKIKKTKPELYELNSLWHDEFLLLQELQYLKKNGCLSENFFCVEKKQFFLNGFIEFGFVNAFLHWFNLKPVVKNVMSHSKNNFMGYGLTLQSKSDVCVC